MNVLGETKESIFLRLYGGLDYRCGISESCSKEDFMLFAMDALEDYVLVPKSLIIGE